MKLRYIGLVAGLAIIGVFAFTYDNEELPQPLTSISANPNYPTHYIPNSEQLAEDEIRLL